MFHKHHYKIIGFNNPKNISHPGYQDGSSHHFKSRLEKPESITLLMRVKGRNVSLEAVRSQTWVENEHFPFFIPDFCAVAAQKSGGEGEMSVFLPTFGS